MIINTEEKTIMKNSIFVFLTLSFVLITSAAFGKGSYGDAVNANCPSPGPYVGDCTLCHTASKSDPTQETAAYLAGDFEYFCPAPVDHSAIDDDGDGYSENLGDCDDTNPSINPGATEILSNGIDENCNGMADDAPVITDTDGDGVIDGNDNCPNTAAGTVVDANGCEIVVEPPVITDVDGDGFDAISFGGFDCNDNDSLINPDGFEICTDGVDNNCNDLVDAADSAAFNCPLTTPLSESFGVYREGAWFIDNNGNGAWDPATDTVYSDFGMDGDLPVVGDWNGDGITQIGVFRNGQWYLDANGNGAWDPDEDTVYTNFGQAGDLPIVGDWNGDGITQIGVFRDGTWYLDASGDGAWDGAEDTVYANFGQAGDLPVVGDWNGDGTAQIGVFRNGQWYLDANGNGAWDPGTDTVYAAFGMLGDQPVSGVWR
jgi:hypothetical protein